MNKKRLSISHKVDGRINGAILAKNVYSQNGILLAGQEGIITKEVILQLAKRGISEVYVYEDSLR